VNHAGGALLGDVQKGEKRRGKMQIKVKTLRIFFTAVFNILTS
jgi:hypothetical protein